MLRGDQFRSRMPHGNWLTLIVFALLNHAVSADDKAVPDDAEMHVIGVYRSKEGPGIEKGGRGDVEGRPTAKPVALVLTSYFPVEWHIKLADGARIKKAIVSGYFAQEIKGL